MPWIWALLKRMHYTAPLHHCTTCAHIASCQNTRALPSVWKGRWRCILLLLLEGAANHTNQTLLVGVQSSNLCGCQVQCLLHKMFRYWFIKSLNQTCTGWCNFDLWWWLGGLAQRLRRHRVRRHRSGERRQQWWVAVWYRDVCVVFAFLFAGTGQCILWWQRLTLGRGRSTTSV